MNRNDENDIKNNGNQAEEFEHDEDSSTTELNTPALRPNPSYQESQDNENEQLQQKQIESENDASFSSFQTYRLDTLSTEHHLDHTRQETVHSSAVDCHDSSTSIDIPPPPPLQTQQILVEDDIRTAGLPPAIAAAEDSFSTSNMGVHSNSSLSYAGLPPHVILNLTRAQTGTPTSTPTTTSLKKLGSAQIDGKKSQLVVNASSRSITDGSDASKNGYAEIVQATSETRGESTSSPGETGPTNKVIAAPRLTPNRPMVTEARPGAYAVTSINANHSSSCFSTFDNLGESSDSQIVSHGVNDPNTTPVVVSAVLHEEDRRQQDIIINNNISRIAEEYPQDIETTDPANTNNTERNAIHRNDSIANKNKYEEFDDEDNDNDMGQKYLKYVAISFFVVAIGVVLMVRVIVLFDRNQHEEDTLATNSNEAENNDIILKNIQVRFHRLDFDGRLWKLLALETAELNNRYMEVLESSQPEKALLIPPFSGDVTANVDVLQGLNNDATPQYRAYEWLAEDGVQYLTSACNETLAEIDPFNSGCLDLVDRQAVLERYTFATIYYALGGIIGWAYDDNWLSHETSLCEWYIFGGLVCNEPLVTQSDENIDMPSDRTEQIFSRTVRLSLDRNFLIGTMPIEIGFLTHMTKLTLAENRIFGTIPPSLTLLSRLGGILFAQNQLTGTIPTFLGTLTNFERLRLANNRFNGTVPTEIGLMTNLLSFTLQDNDVTGTIPDEICNLVESYKMDSLISDCQDDEDDNEITCPCCTECCTSDGFSCVAV